MSTASVIIAFYNNVEYLRMVLAGLERQSNQHFEVVIADDGSPAPVVSLIDELRMASPFRIHHVWHEDSGFRKNKILNKALRACSTEYFIFIDMDCVPHREFIREHIDNKAEHIFLSGRRVNLSEKFTLNLTPERIRNGYLEAHSGKLISDGIFGKSTDVEKGMYVTSSLFRKIINKKKRGILGCNFSVHKKDILAINGFDERYEAPSIGEDSDIQFRLELLGITMRSLNNIAIQYHLYHTLQPRQQKNLDLFIEIQKKKTAYTRFGVDQENGVQASLHR